MPFGLRSLRRIITDLHDDPVVSAVLKPNKWRYKGFIEYIAYWLPSSTIYQYLVHVIIQ